MILIRKVKEQWGGLGNMSPHPVMYEGQYWKTTEALFQALRFRDTAHREEIRREASPMGAKFKAKSLAKVWPRMVIPLSDGDLDNMRLVLRLKYEQHAEIRELLAQTGSETIVEDCTARQYGTGLFWGAGLQSDGTWKGKNWLGLLWTEIRSGV